jgi:hypothetical protein
MKTHKLVIENNSIKINEVEVSIDQIAKSTGVGETVSTLNQLVKVVAANVKLALGVVLSFRSLNAKKIAENINAENRKFGSRIRFAMRKIDQNIEEATRDTKIGEVFACTMPFSALANHVRTEVDNAGGLGNYLEDFSQNTLVGDFAKDVYDLCEKAFGKTLDINIGGSGEKETDNEKEKIKCINAIIEEFRKEFGERAEQLLKDLGADKQTPDVEEFKNLITRIDDMRPDEKNQEILNFFRSLSGKESVEEGFKNRLVNISRLIINEEKQSKSKTGYIDALAACISSLDLDKIFIKTMFNEKEIVKNNIQQDIEEFSIIYQSLICDNIVFKLVNNYINKNNVELDQTINLVDKNIPKTLKKDVLTEIKRYLDSLKAKFVFEKDIDTIQAFINILDKIENNTFYKNKDFVEYSKRLKESSNVNSKEMKSLKNSISYIYKENISFRIKDAKQNLVKKAEELNED